MSGASVFGSPIPLSEIESVLAWVDTFKLSRPTKKIHRDFSDAVLLAEILAEHYPKLVEMHNYPPRNSHALKLNNWMTLNRKVLKKLKLNLCCNTMEQLANCAPGVIERVLVMVRDKIRRDEELNKSTRDAEQNMSSGGSYYEACGDDENVLVVPVKTRVNGVLETIQQKVVNYEAFLAIKEELKDAKDTVEILKQKVEHLDNLLKLKDERINELQKQLDRKQSRRKDAETLQNSIMVPFETPLSPVVIDNVVVNVSNKTSNTSIKLEPNKSIQDISKIPIPIEIAEPINLPNPKVSFTIIAPKRIDPESDEINNDIDRIHSNVFKEAELLSDRNLDGFQDTEEFKDSEPGGIVTIEDAIQNEIRDIIRPTENNMNVNSQEAVNVSLVKT